MNCNAQVPLSSVAEIVSTKVSVSSVSGHPYISTEHLLPNLGGLEKGELPEEGRVNSFKKTDTLFSNIRPYFRKVYYAPADGGCSADVLVFRSTDELSFLPAYLYYSLADPTFISHTMATCKGAKMPRGDKEAMLRYQVFKPSIDTQRKISSFLKSLDDSILALQHQNIALESIAQTLFRSWFVRFDPVHAKAAGNAPAAMSDEIAALFPSEFEDSDLGPIPKGWAAGALSAICALNPESWTKTTKPHQIKYIDLASVKENTFLAVDKMAFSEAPSRARRVLIKGDSIYGTVRPGNLSYGYIGANEKGLTGSTGFAVLRPYKGSDAELVYCAMTLKENIERLTHLADGAAYPAVQPSIVHSQSVAIAPDHIRERFHQVVAPFFEYLTINKKTIENLQQLRDHLMPRLISGKLSLEAAEEAVEELIPA